MSAKLIYLMDLSHETSLGLGSDTMPYQLGLIASYCKKQLGDRVEFEIFKYLKDFEAAMGRRAPFLVGASNYLWTSDLSRQVLTILKRKHPQVLTVMGGPNYPDERERQELWLRQHPEVDLYLHKDGEIPFAGLVASLLDNPDPEAVKRACLPSCHAIAADGSAHFGADAERLRDLAVIPSPYLSGMMDKFFDGRLIPMIQTNRGCPFSCTFCVEGGDYYRKVARSSVEDKKAEVDYIAQRVHGVNLLRISDSNFGMFKEDVELSAHIGATQERTGYPTYVYCSAGKNRQERILKCNELVHWAMRLTASVQSFHPDVLKHIKRENIQLDSLIALSDQISDTITHSYSEIILALPGDSIAATEYTFQELMKVGINTIIQHQLALLEGTEMASRESRERFGLQSRFRPAQRCFGVYEFLGERIASMEVEEICVASHTMPFQEYLEGRRFYLTAVLFYNDRIFGEIHGLLRLLGLPTSDWIRVINKHYQELDEPLRTLYADFVAETQEELWERPEPLREDFAHHPEKYIGGAKGLNVIYKYKAKAILENFATLNRVAYRYLEKYLQEKGIDCAEVLAELQRYSLHSRDRILELDYQASDTFRFDVPRLMADVAYGRSGGGLDGLRRELTLHFRHTPEQREAIRNLLNFYGTHLGGYTMLLSRFPLKRMYRQVSAADGAVQSEELG